MSNIFSKFFGNILWLNIKRFKIHIFWRILLILINFMLFYSTILPVSISVIYYIFAIITLSNLLFIYIRIYSEGDSIILMRSFGASKTFIILDTVIEIVLEILIAAILFSFIYIYSKHVFNYLILLLFQILIVSIITPIFTIIEIFNLEKNEKDL